MTVILVNISCLVSSLYLSYWVWKLSTSGEFTISSVRSFHLFTNLTQSKFTLKDLRAVGFFSFLLWPRVCKSENSKSLYPSEYHQYYVWFSFLDLCSPEINDIIPLFPITIQINQTFHDKITRAESGYQFKNSVLFGRIKKKKKKKARHD